MAVPILILAGGASSRMNGIDKLMMLVDGVPLIRRQVTRALAASDQVTVVNRRGFPARAEALSDLKVRVVEPEEALEGMGGSIRAGLAALKGPPRFLMLLADLVEIGAAEIASVLAAPHIAPHAVIWRGATDRGEAGHPILFDEATYPALSRLAGDAGGREVVEAFEDRVHLVPLRGNRARLDLDTPEDWAAWRGKRA